MLDSNADLAEVIAELNALDRAYDRAYDKMLRVVYGPITKQLEGLRADVDALQEEVKGIRADVDALQEEVDGIDNDPATYEPDRGAGEVADDSTLDW